MLSIVVPIYKSEANIPRLMRELNRIAGRTRIEVVFVVDGSPDRSVFLLKEHLADAVFPAQLVCLSRNFGVFNAVRCGLEIGQGDYFAVLPADLQEPADLVLQFLALLEQGNVDIAFAVRSSRSDPWFDVVTSRIFWALYRRFVLPELPDGGVHTFGCTRAVRDRLATLREPTINLVALLFWLGYRRAFVTYDRHARVGGRSAWTLGRKVRYAIESIFNFTDLPIRLLLTVGTVGTLVALLLGAGVLTAWATGRIEVPGYTALALLLLFFGSIATMGSGIIGQYLWLVLQTTRGRPGYVVENTERFAGVQDLAHRQ